MTGPSPDGYLRVLDYSIFKSLLVPYSETRQTGKSGPGGKKKGGSHLIIYFGMWTNLITIDFVAMKKTFFFLAKCQIEQSPSSSSGKYDRTFFES